MATDSMKLTEDRVATESVRLSEHDRVATITIDVPDTKVNTLSTASMTQLNTIVDKLSKRTDLKAVLFVSGKDDNFIAGADVVEIQSIQKQGQLAAYNASQLGKEIFAKVELLPATTLAVINGTCLGGGTELALACKYRIASSRAKIGLPEIKLGFIPGWGGCVRLPKLVGLQKALELIMTGKVLDAKRAWKAGLVSEVVEQDVLLKRAMEIAGGAKPKRHSKDLKTTVMAALLEGNPAGRSVVRNAAYKSMMRETKGRYPAPKEALNVVLKSMTLPPDKAYENESRIFSRLAVSEVSKNLVGIFFAQTKSKKLPLAESGGKRSIKTVGVLGAGVMGAGIAQAAAKAGYNVIVKDIDQKFLDKGKSTLTGLFDSLVEKRRMTKEEAQKLVDNVRWTTSYADMKGCDLVIEAVLEDLEVKQKALAELESTLGNDFVFATNTSSLSVSDIANGSSNDGAKVVGLHFFNPVHKMPLVEVVRGTKTGDEQVAAAMSVALKLDKTTVVTKDSPGFVVNRILAPYMREAAVLAEEGVPIEEIDKAMKSFGMPMGPMTLLDEVGLDIAAKVIQVLRAALGERLDEPELLGKIKNLKLLGKKGGKGIYLYDEKGKPAGVNPDVAALISKPARPASEEEGKKAHTKSKGEIQDRLVLLMVNEAARCLEEGVVTEPDQLDLALIFGIGFPPFTGGILKYADAEGLPLICQKLDYLARVHGPRYEPCSLIRKKAEAKDTFYP